MEKGEGGRLGTCQRFPGLDFFSASLLNGGAGGTGRVRP